MFKKLFGKLRKKPLTREEYLIRKYKGMSMNEVIDQLCEQENYYELKEMSHIWFANEKIKNLCSTFEGWPLSSFMSYMEMHKDIDYKYDSISVYDDDTDKNIFFWYKDNKSPCYPNNYIIKKMLYTGFSDGFYIRAKRSTVRDIIVSFESKPITKRDFDYISEVSSRYIKGDFYIPRKEDNNGTETDN